VDDDLCIVFTQPPPIPQPAARLMHDYGVGVLSSTFMQANKHTQKNTAFSLMNRRFKSTSFVVELVARKLGEFTHVFVMLLTQIYHSAGGRR
jgi:hypothetical protein